MKLTQISLLALACAAAPLAARASVDIGVTIGGPEVVVQGQPPPERFETVPFTPGPGYIWIRGHWAWHHERWEWRNGRWEYPAQPGTEWIPGHWDQRGNGWVWIEGRYVVPGAPPPFPGGQIEVIANEAPPAPIFEAIPIAPGPDFFWIGGHWHWNHGWVWLNGRFDRHPHFHPGGGWEAGHWDRRGGHYAWTEGHWR
jgi:WXXGXW repeat (2 copies)